MPFRVSRMKKTVAAGRSQELFGSQIEKVPQDYLVAHIDGGARGNPGPAGYGVVIEDHAGRRVDEFYEFLGNQTNNFAEYSALLAALEYALHNGYRSLRVLSDSELLVKQMTGEYKVRSAPLQELHRRCKALTREFDWFSIRHIPRAENAEADHLANVAMDKARMAARGGSDAQPQRGGSSLTAAATGPKKIGRNDKSQPTLTEVEGVVRDGVVELDATTTLPEGTRVKVRVSR